MGNKESKPEINQGGHDLPVPEVVEESFSLPPGLRELIPTHRIGKGQPVTTLDDHRRGFTESSVDLRCDKRHTPTQHAVYKSLEPFSTYYNGRARSYPTGTRLYASSARSISSKAPRK